jgi:DNA (cytosine-5)-methyltransferase 1
MKYKHLDLFSGIGGFSLGLEATGGFETVAFCDIEEYPRKVLAKHWPNVPIYRDIKELNYDRLKADGIISDKRNIDILTGGYPCTPFSVSGLKKGEEDSRYLWPEMFRLVKELRPSFIIGENVSGHIKLGLDTVLQDLESEGYSTRAFSISASSIGAKHQRERVWIVANARQYGGGIEPTWNPESVRRRSSQKTEWSADTDTINRSSQGAETLADTDSKRRCLWETNRQDAKDVGQSPRSEEHRQRHSIGRMDGIINGLPKGFYRHWGDKWEEGTPRVAENQKNKTMRLKALGNSVVPQIPYYIGLSILQAIRGGE